MNEQQAVEIIRILCGESPEEITKFSLPDGGDASDCFRFSAGGQRLFLKVNKQPFYLLAILLFEKLLFYPPDSPHGRWAIRTVKEILRAHL